MFVYFSKCRRRGLSRFSNYTNSAASRGQSALPYACHTFHLQFLSFVLSMPKGSRKLLAAALVLVPVISFATGVAEDSPLQDRLAFVSVGSDGKAVRFQEVSATNAPERQAEIAPPNRRAGSKAGHTGMLLRWTF